MPPLYTIPLSLHPFIRSSLHPFILSFLHLFITTARKVKVPGIAVGLAVVKRRQPAGEGGETDRALLAKAAEMASLGTDKSIAPFAFEILYLVYISVC